PLGVVNMLANRPGIEIRPVVARPGFVAVRSKDAKACRKKCFFAAGFVEYAVWIICRCVLTTTFVPPPKYCDKSPDFRGPEAGTVPCRETPGGLRPASGAATRSYQTS